MEANFSPSTFDPHVDLSLTDFPNEILEKICDNLPLEDVKSLTLTCKQINHLISKSPLIMRKMLLWLQNLDTLKSTLLIRNYQNFEIYRPFNLHIEDNYELFLQYGEHLKELTFNCTTDSYFILKILECCKNLEVLSLFMTCKRSNNKGQLERSLELPKLKSVCINESSWLLQTFQRFNIQCLDIHAIYSIQFPMYNNWRLKTLRVQRAIEEISNISTFRVFLLGQKDSLENLSLTTDNASMVKFVMEELNLKKLHISGIHHFPQSVDPYNLCSKIVPNLISLKISMRRETATTRDDFIYDILRRFPALKDLTLDFNELYQENCEENFRQISLPNLKSLTIRRAHSNFLKYVKFPKLETLFVERIQGNDLAIIHSVRKVTVKRVTVPLTLIGLLYPNIEHLRIEESCEITYSTLMYALDFYLKKLQLLEVSRAILPSQYSPGIWSPIIRVIEE